MMNRLIFAWKGKVTPFKQNINPNLSVIFQLTNIIHKISVLVLPLQID